MAGHSKWANIRHRKAAQDAKRGKLFTKLIRELVSAAREAGSDADANPRLRAAIDKALSNNMKRDTIDNAIARGAGNAEGDALEAVVYEGYGPGGTAIMVESLTDNRNRTVAEIRHAFSKNGGNLGTDGSVAYLFTKTGVLSFAADVDEERLMEASLEVGATDVHENDDGSFAVHTTPDRFGKVKDALNKLGLSAQHAEVTMLPSTRAELDIESAPRLMKLIEMLDDLDDVQEVHSNAEIPDDVMAVLDF